MSDVSQGPGWWQASDGKWYPPEATPQYPTPSEAVDQTTAVDSGQAMPNPESGTSIPAVSSVCTNGHGLRDVNLFCTVCGSPRSQVPVDSQPLPPLPPLSPLSPAPQPYAPSPAPGQVPPPAQYPPINPGYAGSGPPFPPPGPQTGWVPGSPVQPANTTNGLAIASLVLGILWLFGLGSILALIFGFIARQQIRTRRQNGNGLSIAGIVLGFVGVGLLILVIIGAATSNGSQTVDLTVVQYVQTCANSQLRNGTTVIVTGNNGTQLAAASLSAGSDGSAGLTSGGGSIPTCTFDASMTLPTNQSSYSFTVGSGSPITFSVSEMNSHGWKPGITLGCNSEIQGCSGGSTASSSPVVIPTTTTATTAARTGGFNSNSTFCKDLAQESAAETTLSTGLSDAMKTNDLATIKTAFNTFLDATQVELQKVTGAASSAPANVKAAFKTITDFYAQLKTTVAGASSVAQIQSALTSLTSNAAATSADTTISAYVTGQCGTTTTSST